MEDTSLIDGTRADGAGIDENRVDETRYRPGTTTIPRYRRVGLRMNCPGCEVAWTGPLDSPCWVCDGPGQPGPPPSIYPDLD